MILEKGDDKGRIFGFLNIVGVYGYKLLHVTAIPHANGEGRYMVSQIDVPALVIDYQYDSYCEPNEVELASCSPFSGVFLRSLKSMRCPIATEQIGMPYACSLEQQDYVEEKHDRQQLAIRCNLRLNLQRPAQRDRVKWCGNNPDKCKLCRSSERYVPKGVTIF